MQYRRMPIEIEAPEWIGYEHIECNLSESAFADQKLGDLDIQLGDLVLHYGDHLGKLRLRELVADAAALSPVQILVTPGAAAALFIVATSILEKNDHLVVMKPNYATNIETPRAIGASISFLPLRFEDAFELDIKELERLITPQTKLVSLTYPHNPTGVLIDEARLKEIIHIIERNNCYLLMDETYREMSFTSRLPVAASLSEKVISISSMSKAYGLPGIRIGWIACKNARLMETFLAAKEQIIITNSVTDEEIACQYLENKERLFAPVKQKLLDHFALVREFIQGQQLLEWVTPQGGCVCFPRIKAGTHVDMPRFYEILLKKYKTYVGAGHWFEEGPRYMRIGFGWETSGKLKQGLENILSAIGESRIT
ncbi:MAG: pyridoxal phosphate-dependent aminotransferase [Chitinophagaceae bacterium]|jgi:aspartate/methionine/tyrosine aminotransferase|nr:pyridoxal phosphate-dependent aminotransferase [Chitinophagaceae bacterium]